MTLELENKVDKLDFRLDRIEARIERHLKPPFPPDIDDLTARVDALEKRLFVAEHSGTPADIKGLRSAMRLMREGHDRELTALRYQFEAHFHHIEESDSITTPPLSPQYPPPTADAEGEVGR
jgi:hypothetical protein